MNSVFLSIGSNQGDRLKYIKKSIRLIQSQSNVKIIKKSKIYETEPMYNLNQDFFLNMVVLIRTNIEPLELLNLTQCIEKKIGRINLKNKKNLPRMIDIDILDYEKYSCEFKNLILPHPKISERVFVLKPWTDIDPDYKLFNMEQSISELLSNISLNSNTIKYFTEL